MAKLIQAGHKVVIVEQTSDDSAQTPLTKGLMEREVAVIVSPLVIAFEHLVLDKAAKLRNRRA